MKWRNILFIQLVIGLAAFTIDAPGARADEEILSNRAIFLRDFDAAAASLRARANAGDQDAQYRLAGLYRRGLGVPKDPLKAAELYQSLAAAGHPASMALLDEAPAERWPTLLAADDQVAALHWCAQSGNLDAARQILDTGADPDGRRTHGRTALIEAAEAGETAMIRLLLDHGADPDLVDDSNDSALLLAVRRANETAAAALIAAGANVGLADAHGNTALIIATRKGDARISSLLIRAGAPVNATNQLGQNALGIANVRGHLSLAATLRKKRRRRSRFSNGATANRKRPATRGQPGRWPTGLVYRGRSG